MNRTALLAALPMLAVPSLALANPSPAAGPYAEYVALFVETLLVAAILGFKGFDPVRFLYSWALVTGTTFMLLVGWIYSGVWLLETLLEPAQLRSQGWLGPAALFSAEALIVLIEAVALRRMTALPFFQRKAVQPVRFGQALRYSFSVNLVSLLLSL